MISPKDFYDALRSHGIRFFTGVPDSLLRDLCACIEEHSPDHVAAAHEGSAAALAAGHYLATGAPAAVYMQNSGLGNAVNPLISLASREVYRIPMLLIIGWRGEPGIHDEPQHKFQGEITTDLLDLMRIPYEILDGESDGSSQINSVMKHLEEEQSPAALVVKSGTFHPYQRSESSGSSKLLREEALEIILTAADDQTIFITTTGKTSREMYELRRKYNQSQRDFLTVGSMGHSSSIALGIALETKDRKVVCIDGDGAMLMHMGALAVIGETQPENFIHVVINNKAHESVGGQPTASQNYDLEMVAKGLRYSHYYHADDGKSLKKVWKQAELHEGPTLLEVHTAVGSRKDLGRPDTSPEENKRACMEFIRKGSF